MEDRSTSVPSAAASRRSYMGGTPRKNVQGSRRWAARTSAVSNFGNMATVAPMRSPARKPIVKPKAWKRGRMQ